MCFNSISWNENYFSRIILMLLSSKLTKYSDFKDEFFTSRILVTVFCIYPLDTITGAPEVIL